MLGLSTRRYGQTVREFAEAYELEDHAAAKLAPAQLHCELMDLNPSPAGLSGRFNKSRWVIPDEPSFLPNELDLEVVGI